MLIFKMSRWFLKSVKSTLSIEDTQVKSFCTRNNILLQMDNKQRLVLQPTGKTVATLNGYGLNNSATYFLEKNDVIESEGEVNTVVQEMEPTKRLSDETNTPTAKRMKMAPIFNIGKAQVAKDESDEWKNINNDILIYTPKGLLPNPKIIAFDMDGTLIKPKNGKTFPSDHNDWEPYCNQIKKVLQENHENNYKIVVFSNQKPLGNKPEKIKFFKEKVKNIIQFYGVPMQMFLALKSNIYRKPCVGMWDTFIEMNGVVNISETTYVGDAAGRPKGWSSGKKKDHSNADRLFALNLGLKFKTPEEFFMKSAPVKFEMPNFNPTHLKSIQPNFKQCHSQEVIMMVGCPGSGKSQFCKKNLKNYVYINRDTLNSKQACLSLLNETIKKGKSAVIDNLHRDVASRKEYLEQVTNSGIPCRCFVMKTEKEHAMHNNKFRQLTDSSHKPVADVIIHSFYKYYEEPTVKEGFQEVIKIDFCKYTHDDPEKDKLYNMYLLEH